MTLIFFLTFRKAREDQDIRAKDLRLARLGKDFNQSKNVVTNSIAYTKYGLSSYRSQFADKIYNNIINPINSRFTIKNNDLQFRVSRLIFCTSKGLVISLVLYGRCTFKIPLFFLQVRLRYSKCNISGHPISSGKRTGSTGQSTVKKNMISLSIHSYHPRKRNNSKRTSSHVTWNQKENALGTFLYYKFQQQK